jgi:GNAT superfamily N-acetyltransferase
MTDDFDAVRTWVVRTATIDDAAQISALLAELSYLITPDQVVYELANQPGTVVLVAETDQGLTGLAAVNTRRQLHEAAPVSTIDALIVTDRLRSRGIGAALVTAAEDLARGEGASMLDLHSGLQRVDARRFYERMGLRVIGNHFIKYLERT